jgi:hypothetical protein
MKFREINFFLLCFFILNSFSIKNIQAQNGAPSEYEVKAAYIFNFAKFIEWPSYLFPNNNNQFIIGILGSDPFGESFEKIINKRLVHGKTVEIKRIKNLSENESYHILFISSSEKKKIKYILKSLEEMPILTIGEVSEFNYYGGIIQFILEENSVLFRLNADAARTAGLSISSQLLEVARIYKK